ncbi:hypothetical protein J2S32_001691 [Qipengyuania citrea]|jgi:hypothetical protein|nr:hypothetical protein [Qipengyuania citrea]
MTFRRLWGRDLLSNPVAEKAMPKMSIDSHEAATGELHRVRAGLETAYSLDDAGRGCC